MVILFVLRFINIYLIIIIIYFKNNTRMIKSKFLFCTSKFFFYNEIIEVDF